MASEHAHNALASNPRWHRWRWPLDLILVGALWLLAARLRLAWDDLLIVTDVPWFVHSSNAIALGERAPFLQLLYGSVPCGVFALLIRVFQDPIRLLQAWGVLGALSAPVTYLAVRRLAGPVAGFAAGVLMALSTADVALVTGIKSPYVISLFSGIMVLGLVAATLRRPWGVPTMIFGAAMAVAFHLGLWPIAPLVCVLGALHLLRLPRRQAVLSGAVATLLGGLVVAWTAVLDLEHLLGDLDFYRGEYPSQAPSAALDQVVWQLNLLWKQQLAFAGSPALAEGIHDMFFQGLVSTVGTLQLVSAGIWLGAVALAVQLALAWRQRGGLSQARRRQLAIGLAGLQAWLLLLVGSTLYLRNAWLFDYLQYHHLVALVPVMIVAVVGLLAMAAPPRAWAWSLLPCALLVGWYQLTSDTVLFDPRQPASKPATTEVGVRSTRTAAQFAVVMRDHAILAGVQPGMVLWGPWGDSHEPWLFVSLVNSFARLAWDADDLPQGCYLATTPRKAGRVPGAARLAEHGDQLVLLALPSCQALSDLDAQVCGTIGSRAWRADPSAPTLDESAWLQDWLSCPLNAPVHHDPGAPPQGLGH